MISFRLSASEYAEAEQVCRAHGYRSVSLFARCALLASMSRSDGHQPYDSQIVELRERMNNMAAELFRISAEVRKTTDAQEPAERTGALDKPRPCDDSQN